MAAGPGRSDGEPDGVAGSEVRAEQIGVMDAQARVASRQVTAARAAGLQADHGRDQLLLDGPLEELADQGHPAVDFGAAERLLDEGVAASLQCPGAELRGLQMAECLSSDPDGQLDDRDLPGRPSVFDVIGFDTRGVTNYDFRDRDVRGQLDGPLELGPGPIGLRTLDEVLLPDLGFRRAVGAKVVVLAVDPDAGLAGRLVVAVERDPLGTRHSRDLEMGGTTVLTPSYPHSQSTLAAPPRGREFCKSSLRQDLRSVGATGFEPVTSSTPS